MRAASTSVWLAAAVLLPTLALAQGTLTGTVRDQSSAVLPGVTVEAASPALIEKVRAAVTDSTGQYRITGLNPGTYSLTFRLTGFNVVKREGIELGGTTTLTIPVDMRVGALEETITVTGESPVVDVQTAQRETVLSADVVAAVPGNRSVGTLLNAVPGLVVNEGALAASPTMTFFAARGGPINEGPHGDQRHDDRGAVQRRRRVHLHPGFDQRRRDLGGRRGGLGESDIGGPMMNLVPRSGGNQFRGSAFINNAGDWSRGNNLTPALTAPPPGPNLAETPGIINSYDTSVSYGGPTQARSTLVLWQLSQPEHGGGGHGRRRTTRTPTTPRAGTGWATRGSRRGRCRDARRTSDRITAQVSSQTSHLVQPGVPAPLRGIDTADRKRQRLQHARRRLGRGWEQAQRTPSPEANPSLLRQPSVSRQPGDMDGADDEQAPARGGLHPLHVPRRNDGPASA